MAEVADTTLRYDRTLKLRAYAQARIPVYWVVNLEDRQLEVYANPRTGADPGFAASAVYRPGDLAPHVIAGVADVLP